MMFYYYVYMHEPVYLCYSLFYTMPCVILKNFKDHIVMKELHVSFVCLPAVLGSNKDYLNLNLNLNWSVEHAIITRDNYCVSNFQSRNVTLSFVFKIICNVAYYSAAKFTFPIEQPSNKATKCGIRRSWKLKVKPNLGCCSNISITVWYISVFVSS